MKTPGTKIFDLLNPAVEVYPTRESGEAGPMSTDGKKPQLIVAEELRRAVDEAVSALNSTLDELRAARVGFEKPSET